MASYNRVRVQVMGSSYSITTTETKEYIHSLEEKLNAMLNELMRRHTGISISDALVLTCLNLLDSSQKSEAASDHIRGQLTEYLQDAARARIELDEANREIERLGRELALHKR